MFFDAYSQFLDTSKTGATSIRLNARYRAIIEHNRALFPGREVLDIASHDGRWSFAALDAGASKVVGIEARDHLVRNANENMSTLGVAEERYEFILGDVFEVMKQRALKADLVLLLGFFYHTERHGELASLLSKTGASHIILDTNILPAANNPLGLPLSHLFAEPTSSEANAVGSDERAVVGHPSREAIKLIFSNQGFGIQEFDWVPFRGGSDTLDYNQDRRSTFLLSR